MIRKETAQVNNTMGLVDIKRLVHDLQTHKIELEMQNEELRRAEIRLRQSAKRYADLYDFAPVGYLTLSRHGVIREINLKGAGLLQKDRVLLIGDVFQKYIHEGYVEIFQQHLADIISTRQKQSCNVRLKSVDDETFYVHIESIAWLDEGTSDIHIRSVLNDITAQTRIEAELIRVKEKAEKANLAKSQFLANMSHEIRTPLGVMLGYSDLMLMELADTSPLMKPTSAIKRNGEHLLQVIDDILDISRIEAGELVVALAPCKPEQEIRDTVASLRQKAEAKGLGLELTFQEGIPSSALTDATRLRQIVMNLVNNAIKFTATGRVQVRVSHQETPDYPHAQHLVVDVIDTGCGIPVEAQDMLFKPFSQVDSSHSRKFGGVGLGLYLCRRLALALGGDVTLLDSRPGVGSTFRARLSMRVVNEDSVLAMPCIPTKVGPSELKGTTVLLVEDSPDNQFVLRNMIEMAGGKVYCADDGVHAISMALETPVDLVLMDLQLPLLDGYKATSELRRHHFKKPVLALTAHALHEEREKVLRSQDFDGFLTKPIGFKPLVETLKKWTGRNNSGSGPYFTPLH